MTIEIADLLLYIASGAGVGLLIGLTGVGGGSLMTPLLIMMNIPYHIAIGTDLEVIKKSGSWFSYNTTKIAQGREAAKQFMLDNPEVALEVETAIKAKISGKEVDTPEEKEAKAAEPSTAK